MGHRAGAGEQLGGIRRSLDISLKEPPLLALKPTSCFTDLQSTPTAESSQIQGEKHNRKGFKKNKPSRRAYRKGDFNGSWVDPGLELPTPITSPSAEFPFRATASHSPRGQSPVTSPETCQQRALDFSPEDSGVCITSEALLGEHPGLSFLGFWETGSSSAFPPDPWGPQLLPRNSLFPLGIKATFSRFWLEKPCSLWPLGTLFSAVSFLANEAAGHPLCLDFTQGWRPPASPGSAAYSLTRVLCRALSQGNLKSHQVPDLPSQPAAGSLTSPTATQSISGSRPPFLLPLPICPLLAGHRVPVPGRSMRAYVLSRLSCIQLFVIHGL